MPVHPRYAGIKRILPLGYGRTGQSTTGGIANVTQFTDDGSTKIVVADAFATGIIAMYNLPVAVDITQGTRIGLAISSTIDTAAADVDLLYSDTVDLGGTPIEVSLPALAAGVNT